ncbi:acyltransferase family protein [Leifsonia shinshuensis]|uniref:Fucose 4-O-acetylase-like acetyltransferase n=1 Tax=Leifsonia shinshuensis TaxID=150026 RepID=A0A853CTX1_9MICO|nr:acyltransferase family protein [Leifsonia shinshuensis]NYJ23779.1 fucose 4-O-acetylase-like acetyltransferase [Leifsonia shinshuensis]
MTNTTVANAIARPRSAAIDAVRVLGVVAIVYGHVFGLNFLRSSLFIWHVPVFFVLTGYLWTANRSILTEVRKRTLTLLVPYAAWLLIILSPLVNDLILHGRNTVPLEIALRGGALLTGQFAAFWFVTALFFAAIYLRLLERLPEIVQWAVPLVALVALWVFHVPFQQVPLSAGVAVPCLIFVLAGRQLKRVRSRVPRPGLVGLGLLVVGFALVATNVVPPVDLKQSDFGLPIVTVLVSIGICFGLILVAEEAVPLLGRVTGAIITRLALTSFMVILTHAVVIQALRPNAPLGSPKMFLAALIIPWVLALLVNLTPLSRILIGVPMSRLRLRSRASKVSADAMR